MSIDPKIVDKIQKLLALGTSPNEHEAAAAIAKAQSLMEQYDLEMADLQKPVADTAIEQTDGEVFAVRGKPEEWRNEIANAVARTSGLMVVNTSVQHTRKTTTGKIITSWESGYSFIGYKRDLELAKYSVAFLLSEVQRLCDAYVGERWQEIWDFADRRGYTHQEAEAEWKWTGKKHPLTARKSWLEGAGRGVATMLRESKQGRLDQNTNLNALVVLKDEMIRDWWYMKRHGKTYAQYRAEQDARYAEYAAANPAAVVAEPKIETPAQRRAREEKDQRASDRANRRYWNEYQREQAARDHSAYSAGHETGRSIGMRPGVSGGAAPSGEIGR